MSEVSTASEESAGFQTAGADIVVAGVGREGASIVHALKLPAAAARKLYVTAVPAQAVAESTDLIRIHGGENWEGLLSSRLAGAKVLLAVSATTCREASFMPTALTLGQTQGALALAMLVEPLFASSPHRADAASELVRNVLKTADSSILALSNLHPPSSLTINEAMETWNRKISDAVSGLVSAMSAESVLGMDFQDIHAVLSSHGRATIGLGSGKSVEEALRCAARQALALEPELETACSVLAYLTISDTMPLDDARRAGSVLEQLFPKAQVASGVTISGELRDVSATIIAGKLDAEVAQAAVRRQASEVDSAFFKVGDPSVYEGENLDVPAFVRKAVVLPGGPPRAVPEQRTLFEPTRRADAD